VSLTVARRVVAQRPPVVAAARAQALPSGELARLDAVQRQVLAKMDANAAPLSDAAHAQLLARVERLGFSEADLEKALDYLGTKAPVTVAFVPDKETSDGTRLVDALARDGRWRNQFETGTSEGKLAPGAGGERDRWEKKLFMGLYQQQGLIPAQRPKYGTLDAAKNPTDGTMPQYGDAYFVLKPAVHARATFTPYDSAGHGPEIVGTAGHLEHVLNDWAKYAPATALAAVMNVALGKIDHAATPAEPYIETQIHGPLELSRDVESLVASSRYRGTPYEAKLRALAQRYGIPLTWNDAAGR
jgi:hypothetical protein